MEMNEKCMSSDTCDPGLERSDFSDLGPLDQNDPVARNFPTHDVSAQPELGDRHACNISAPTESVDARADRQACSISTQTESVDARTDRQACSISTQTESVDACADRQACSISAPTESVDARADGQACSISTQTESVQVTDKDKEVIRKKFTENGQTFLATIFKKPVTDKYKHFITAFHHQRGVWIVPVLEIIDKPSECFQLISPDMPSLETWLKNCKLNTRDKAVIIAYQIMAGLVFLHSRNVVHGDLSPRHVLFDQCGNARLVCCGMYTAYSVEESVESRQADSVHSASDNINRDVCFVSDLQCFARILLRLLMPADSNEQEQSDAMGYLTSSLHKLQKSYNSHSAVLQFDYMSFIEKYVNQVMWPADNITRRTIKVLLQCLCMACNGTRSSELKDELKSIMQDRKLCRISVKTETGIQNNEICRYCTVKPVHPELQLRSTSCPATCPFLCACISCMCLLGSQRYVCRVNNDVCSHLVSVNSDVVENICPAHEYIIEPVIGGGRAYAMILHATSHDIAAHTANDAMCMMQLASHPNVMQIPYKNVHAIDIPDKTDSTFEQKCESVVKKMEQILDGNPSFFLFYFSGHQLVQAQENYELLPRYDLLVNNLSELIGQIAEVCPRVLLIFDCCHASAVADLFEVILDADSHVEWHAQWISCRRKQLSNIDEGDRRSRFTEMVHCSLKGGTQTPHPQTEMPCALETRNCYICSKYGESCSENGYVILYDIADVVQHRMHYRQCNTQESPSDVQQSLPRGTFPCKPIFSFFNREPFLYTFFVENMFDCSIHRYETDDLDVSNIWRMTVDHRSKEACHVEFYDRHTNKLLVQIISDGKDMKSTDCKPILDAVSKDNKCLLVKFVDTRTPVDVQDDGEDDTAVEIENKDKSSSAQTEDPSESRGSDGGSSDDSVQFGDEG